MRQVSMEIEDGLPSYIGRLTQVPLLTVDEELTLTLAAKQGDGAAKKRLVESNMRLVINIAKTYRSKNVQMEDLIQEGAIGLIQAVNRFEPDKGFRFSTYATHWIRQAISRAIDNKSKSIRLPAHIAQSLRKIERARVRLATELGYDPTAEQLAIAIGVSPSRLTSLMTASQELLSLDMKIGDGDYSTLGSLLADDQSANPETILINQEKMQELYDILAELSDRERHVMSQRLRTDTSEDITEIRDRLASEMCISRERIRQIELQAIRKLRSVAQKRKITRDSVAN